VGGWSTPCPSCFTFGKKTHYPLYNRLGGSHGRSGRVRKISPPPRFDPWIVQHVASRYTYYVCVSWIYYELYWCYLIQCVATSALSHRLFRSSLQSAPLRAHYTYCLSFSKPRLCCWWNTMVNKTGYVYNVTFKRFRLTITELEKQSILQILSVCVCVCVCVRVCVALFTQHA